MLTSLEDTVVFLTNRREARTVLVLLSDGWRLFQPDRGFWNTLRSARDKDSGIHVAGGGMPSRPSDLGQHVRPRCLPAGTGSSGRSSTTRSGSATC